MRTKLRFILMALFLGATVFGSAGRIDLPWIWAWFAVILGVMVSTTRHVDPNLMTERMRPGPGGIDRHLRWVTMPFLIAHLVVAGLDVGRFHWSEPIPFALRIVGLIGLALFLALSGWAVTVNRFFSPVVRIQTERGHHLITDGPYRWIRHPGYLATMVCFPCGAMPLGSWWSLVPIVPIIALMLRRTIIDDRFLHERFDGYREYAARVRYRLVPGVW